MVEEKAAPPQVDASITVTTLLEAEQPRLKGCITSVQLTPKCKHDWEVHRVHSYQVRFVFGRFDAQTIRRACEAALDIRNERTECITIRKIGEQI